MIKYIKTGITNCQIDDIKKEIAVLEDNRNELYKEFRYDGERSLDNPEYVNFYKKWEIKNRRLQFDLEARVNQLENLVIDEHISGKQLPNVNFRALWEECKRVSNYETIKDVEDIFCNILKCLGV